MKSYGKFELFDEENIIFQTNQILKLSEEKTFKIGLIIGTLMLILIFSYGGTLLINGLLNINIVIIIFGIMYIFIGLIILFSEIYLIYFISSNEERVILYLTTNRIIKLINRRLFRRSQKLEQINYNELAYYICWYNSVEFVSKGLNKDIHYTGEETVLKKKPKAIKSIKILLEGIESNKIKEKIEDLLIKTIPMVRHPNLKYLLLSKR
ncbi:MAG: hypothetical protein ACFFD2_12460 [Promethearchaeota archaeon]